VMSSIGSPAPTSVAASPSAIEPNATAVTRTGRVRRHGRPKAGATPATNATPGHTKSSRRVTSSSPAAISAATSTQSRHSGAGACWGRASARNERTALLTASP